MYRNYIFVSAYSSLSDAIHQRPDPVRASNPVIFFFLLLLLLSSKLTRAHRSQKVYCKLVYVAPKPGRKSTNMYLQEAGLSPLEMEEFSLIRKGRRNVRPKGYRISFAYHLVARVMLSIPVNDT